MKFKIIFLILILGLISLLITKNLKADCYDNESNCNGVPWTSRVLTYVYPAYPQCTISIGFKTRYCNGKWQFKYDYMHFLDPRNEGGVCTSLINWLWPQGWNNPPNWDRIRDIFKSSYADLCLQLYKEMVDAAREGGYLDQLDCNHPRTTFSQFVGTCWSQCSGFVDNPNGGYMIVKNVDCTVGVCCELKRSYCYDEINGVQVTIETIPGPSMDCNNQTAPDCNFGPEVQFPFQSPCSASCQIF